MTSRYRFDCVDHLSSFVGFAEFSSISSLRPLRALRLGFRVGHIRFGATGTENYATAESWVVWSSKRTLTLCETPGSCMVTP